MRARIYQPSKTAMQSGRAWIQNWILEYELPSKRKPEPLMGWTSSQDTLNQVKMYFETSDQAVAFAQKKGWEYEVQTSHPRHVEPKTYLNNFEVGKPSKKT